MTTKIVYQRPASLGSGTVDLANSTTREGAPFFDGDQSLVELGHRCYNGEASQGEFKFNMVDLTNWETDFPSAHCLVTMVEDSQTPDIWLSRGRVATDEGGRGLVKADGELEWTVTVEDGNIELRGQGFTENFVRPEETDIQRLVALQAFTLNGTSSTALRHRDTCNVTINTSHLAPNTNTVTMPAKKYLFGTQPLDVVRDCAETAGKQYGVVIHHTGGSHLCLLYTVNDDHTTYLSAAKISDQLADWVPNSTTTPVFEPHWEQGVGQIIQMQTLLSGMVGTWGPETAVYAEYPGVADNTDHWVETYHDGDSTTELQAAVRVAGLLEGRRNSHVTHRVSVIMNPNQTHLIAAGMSIDIKTAVTFDRGNPGGDPDVYIRRRIGEARFEPRIDGSYWCHMDLERPPLLIAPGKGKIGPIPPVQSEPPTGSVTDYEWTFDDNNNDVTDTYPVGTLATNWHAGYVHTHVLNPGVGNTSASTKPPITPGDYTFTATYHRTSGSPYNSGGIDVDVYSFDGGVGTLIGTTTTTTSYTPITSSISVTVPVGGDEIAFEMPYNNSVLTYVSISHGAAESGFEGTPPPPAASDGSGSTGTSPIYSPSDHQHPAQTADVTPIGDEGGYFEGGNVEEALQELAAELDTLEPLTADDIAALGFVGEILISDTPSTPLVFADLLQNEAEDDLLYGP